MENWSGFSPEDIHRFQSPNIKQNEAQSSNGIHKNHSVKHSHISRSSLKKAEPVIDILPEAKLSNNKCIDETLIDENAATDSTKDSGNESQLDPSKGTVAIVVNEDRSYELISVPKDCVEADGSPKSSNSSWEKKAVVLDYSRLKDHGNCALDAFQEKQKIIEEENKQKKELLSKIIEDRKKRTHLEAQKVLQVQEELSRLDAILSSDIRILRDQIEIAASEFNQAQKRYDKAESEFVEAKMSLFSRLERKEMLTEHLCRIIEANEQRKAKKLSELLAKLEISDPAAAADFTRSTDNGNCISPPQTNFNEISSVTLRGSNGHTNGTYSPADFGQSNHCSGQSRNSSSAEPDGIRPRALELPEDASQRLNLATAQNMNNRNENGPRFNKLT